MSEPGCWVVYFNWVDCCVSAWSLLKWRGGPWVWLGATLFCKKIRWKVIYVFFQKLHLFLTAICGEFNEATDRETEISCCTPRWWFQRFLIFGEMIQFDVRICFQIGLAKPPTRHWLSLVSQSSLFPVTTFLGFWVGHGGWRWQTTYAQASTWVTWAMKKTTGLFRLYIGDYTTQLYRGLWCGHYKDPYQPSRMTNGSCQLTGVFWWWRCWRLVSTTTSSSSCFSSIQHLGTCRLRGGASSTCQP